AQGERLRAKYEAMLSSLSKEVVSSLPAIDEKKKAAFLEARTALASLEAPAMGSNAADVAKYKEALTQVEAKMMDSARALLADHGAFLGSDALDGKLVRISILTHGTPRGLAEFSQQGKAEEALLDKLFADEALMKQIAVAGGAMDGNYGKAMQTYAAILEKNERAREVGTIFQRLALGTSIALSCNDPVERYQHYEKAFLDGELDPAFKDMTPWLCRFITVGERGLDDLAWMRKMLRNYRPDHIRTSDYHWRYIRIVKSDMPYDSIRKDDDLGSKSQQALALGGSCGPRAWFGRLSCRAFGIPSRNHPQTAHGAMSHWTPTGWKVNLGAWWSNSPGGLDFYLDSQARDFPEAYMQVLRAQWIADALGEEKVDRISYGQGGGFWNALAFYKKRVMVADAAIAKSEDEKKLAAMTGDEAKKLLGESEADISETYDGAAYVIPEDHKKIVIAAEGTITLPAASCARPTASTGRILFMANYEKTGTQMHYARLGKEPELLTYYIDAPKDGKYRLTLDVCTIAPSQINLVRLNRRTQIDVELPYTSGMWERTKPVEIELKEGRNTLMLTCKTGRGFTMREMKLEPVK
ncbi:MAG: hypothetical protein K8R87_11760, partial [Verrucomicrobia bacterium]|nr:hypothetical protein [Verrucomicrobiota bacterium]